MPVTDWVYPTVVAGTGWSADSGTLVSCIGYNGGAYNDAVYARNSGAVPQSEWLLCSVWKDSAGTALALPAGAIPEGLEVECEAYTLTAVGAPAVPYIGFYTSKDGISQIGDPRYFDIGPISGAPIASEMVGGPTDLWGAGWSDVEMEGFFLWIGQGPSDTDSSGRGVDFIRARVYYSEAITPPPAVLQAIGDMDHYPGYGIIRPDLEVRF